mgnify:CR=1 FL=1
MNIGLVLEGGAMRGMYTAGVLDVFLDNQIEVENKLQEMYDLGIEDCKNKLDDLKEYLKGE